MDLSEIERDELITALKLRQSVLQSAIVARKETIYAEVCESKLAAIESLASNLDVSLE